MSRLRSIAVLVASSALLLTGCGIGTPGVAATVGQETITIQQVDDLANALCDTAVAAKAGSQATVQMRSNAATILVTESLTSQFGAAQHATFDASQLDSQMSSAAGMIQSVNEPYRATFQQVVQDYVKGQLMLISIGRASLSAQGKTPDDTTGKTEGDRLLVAADIPVDIDPRFGSWDGSAIAFGSGSLSVPVSTSASAADNLNAPGYVDSLPAFAKCG